MIGSAINITMSNFLIFNIFLIVAIAIWIIISTPVKLWLLKIWRKILLLKKYWIIVFTFITISFGWYYYIFQKFQLNDLSNAISIYNNILTLLFACIVWYFAFLQLQEGKISRLENEWEVYPQNYSYVRALQTYSELYSIVPNNHTYITNSLELQLILEKNDEFDKLFKNLWKIV